MRKKTEKISGKSGQPYSDPYLNLINAMFEKRIDDLVYECRNGYYRTSYQDDAYKFFFCRDSWQYKDFLAWCDLTGFNHYFWQKKAVMAIAKKAVKTPNFIKVVTKRISNKAFILQIKMLTALLKKRKTL